MMVRQRSRESRGQRAVERHKRMSWQRLKLYGHSGPPWHITLAVVEVEAPAGHVERYLGAHARALGVVQVKLARLEDEVLPAGNTTRIAA